ncbi:transcriptional regulator [Rhizobium sp. YTU87027]|uniref:transcriptional regulator n=1 Tax=Rhizobium sp. YTU87027 TaxID=3417741 RepID=UPI003D69C95F
MKKPQRRFVVELKSGRRRQTSKPVSIWGNLDLKAVSAAVDAEISGHAGHQIADSAMSSTRVSPAGTPVLTTPLEQPRTVSAPQEGLMANETNTTVNSEPVTSDAAIVAEPKNQRAPRAKKVAPETASADVKVETKAPAAPAKRGRPARAGKTTPMAADVAGKAKRVGKTRAAKPSPAAMPAPISAADDMAELLRLEEENQMLRKSLAEKLRQENADLRKRLGLA